MEIKRLTPAETTSQWNSYLTKKLLMKLSDLTIKKGLHQRLMMYKMTLLAASASSQNGSSLSSLQRRDLGVTFMRIMTETLKYGEDCINLMIEHGFLDQLPMAKEKPTVLSSM